MHSHATLRLIGFVPCGITANFIYFFLTHEILLTFSGVSDYIDAILLSYSAYRLDFRSIQRVHFYLICHRIHPEQVITLTLSDDDDKPGRSELFLSRFRIEQLVTVKNVLAKMSLTKCSWFLVPR